MRTIIKSLSILSSIFLTKPANADNHLGPQLDSGTNNNPTPTKIATAADAGQIEGVPQISLVAVLSFAIKLFFTVAALVALYHLVMGAFKWVSSGGDKEAIDEARNKIQAAVVGLVMIVAILSIAYTLEQFVFRQNICFGISCDIKIPGLLKQGAIKYN